MTRSKTRDFSAFGVELEEAVQAPKAEAAPVAAELDVPKRGRGRPPVAEATEQFTMRITAQLRKKLASVAAEEMARTGRNVTPQQIALRVLEEKFNG